MKLTRGHIPLYYQLQQILREKISSDNISPKEALPTENELCKEYDVSRTTVRQAFNALINEGLIQRIPGKGTFLIEPHSPQKILHYFNATASLVGLPEFATYTNAIHHRGLVLPTEKVAEALNLSSNKKVYRLRGIRLLNDIPLCYFVTCIQAEFAGVFAGEKLKTGATLTVLAKKTGMTVSKVYQTLSASRIDDNMAKYLGLKKKDPTLVFERIYYVEDDRPIEVGMNYFHPDRYQYAMELKHKI